MPNAIIDAIASRARGELRAHPNSELALRLREEMWLSLGEIVRGADGLAKHTEGYTRRVRLAAMSTERVLPLWESQWKTDQPRKLVSAAQEFANGMRSANSLRAMHDKFRVLLDNVQSLERSLISTAYVGFAAADVALVALFDVDDAEFGQGLDDRDLDTWDAAFYACGAYAGEFPWVSTSSPSRRLEFWNWYVDSYLVVALQPGV